MSDERAAMDQVGRYWDAVALGDGAAGLPFDPALARTIHRVQGLAAMPSAEARERVWQTVLANAEAARRQEEGSLLRVLVPDGRALDAPGVGFPEGAPGRRQRAFLAQFATAALIVLMLVGSFVIFGPGRYSRQEQPSVVTPAIEATPSTPETDVTPLAEFLWHADGSPDLDFREPNHPAIDPDGNIWVPDGWNNRFVIFAPDGTWLEDWGPEGSGEGEFLFENGGIGFGGVAFDFAGNIYVADSGNHRVQKFGPDRSFITAWGAEGDGEGEFRQPVALTVDGRGRVYVSDRSDSIEVFDSDGQWLASWGDMGAPVGITTDRDGDVWVADEGLTRVIELSPDGERLTTWNDYGNDDGQLNQPSGIDIDAEGRIFVSDRAQRVQVFAPDGQFLGSWGEFGVEPGKINGPYGVVVGEDGVAYVAEDFGQRLQAFRLLPPFAPGRPDAAEPATSPVVAATPVIADPSPVAFVWETSGGPGLPFDDPTALAIASDGNLWVPDGGNGQFQIFTPDGEFVETWGTPGSGEGEFNFAFGDSAYGAVVWDEDGNIYVADTGNFRIQKFAPDRSYLNAWGVRGNDAGQFQAVTNLAIDRDGRIFAVDSRRYDIQIFDETGAWLGDWGGQGSGDGELLNPGGAAFDADGNLYVSDSLNYRVQTFAPDGRPRGSWKSDGLGDGAFVSPTDVTIDDRGHVFLADWGNHRILVFTTDGTLVTSWGEEGFDEGQFVNPVQTTVDSDGFIYVSDEGSDRVLKFRLLPPLGP